MFGENSFGGLSTGDSTNAVAGPSLTQVDGEETDAEVSNLSPYMAFRLRRSSCSWRRRMEKSTSACQSG